MSSHQIRLLACLAALLVAVSACTGTGEDTGTGEGAGQVDVPDTAPVVELAYSYVAGDVITYEVDVSQRLVLETDGAATAATDGNVPTSADVTITALGNFVYTVSAGPQPGTFEIAIEGMFDDVAVAGTADGEPVDDPEDLGEIGEIEPVSTSVIVDDTGRVVDGGEAAADPFGLGRSPLGLSGDLGRLVGPVLPDEPVAVGETWTESYQEAGIGGEPVEATITATLGGTEDADGVDAYVIDSATERGASEVDLAEFFGGFMGAFVDPEDTATQSSVQDLIDQLVFRISTDPSSSTATTLFDPEAGLVARSETSGASSIQMEVALPDDETGELERFDVDLDVEQSVAYRLVR